ncbi:MAG: CPBP family intramembrane metalloprotease [Fibrobacter sp.]|nr:CPBP family intramembrane metalloprotease [Fibrobacter sp.]
MNSSQNQPQVIPYPNFYQSVILVIIIHLLFLFFHYLIKFSAKLIINNQSVLIPELPYQILYLVIFSIVIIYARQKSGMVLSPLFTFRPMMIKTLLAISVLIIGSSIVLSEGENFARILFNTGYPENKGYLFTQTVSGFLTFCILAPILEEILFRGIILRGFFIRYNPVLAILMSSMVFGIAYTDPLRMTGAFFFGIFLSWITIQSGSVILAIWAHISANVLSFILSLNLLPYIEGFTPPPDSSRSIIIHQHPLFTIAGVVATVIGIWCLLRDTRK